MTYLITLACIYFAGVVHTYIKLTLDDYTENENKLRINFVVAMIWPLLYIVDLILWVKDKFK